MIQEAKQRYLYLELVSQKKVNMCYREFCHEFSNSYFKLRAKIESLHHGNIPKNLLISAFLSDNPLNIYGKDQNKDKKSSRKIEINISNLIGEINVEKEDSTDEIQKIVEKALVKVIKNITNKNL